MSALELKQIQAINAVNTDVDNMTRTDIPAYIQRINNLSALCCAIHWRKQYSHSYRYLQQTHKKLLFTCMTLDEQLTRKLISLDSIEAEGAIRQQRKQTVVKIQQHVRTVEGMIKRCKRIDSRLLARVEKYCNANANDLMTPSASSDNVSNNNDMSNKPIDAKLPVTQRYAHLNLPVYTPKFTQQIDEHGNYIITTKDLHGVQASDIEVTAKGRIVLIEGAKLKPSPGTSSNNNTGSSAMQFFSGLNPFASKPSSAPAVQHSAAYGMFQSRQVLPPPADLDAMTYTLAADGTLLIFIPRKVENRNTGASQQQQQQQAGEGKKTTPPKKATPKAAHHHNVSANKASAKAQR